ncbi:MAG: tol-pal system protein YbgF [Deltaproteobacteria bacterium]|nr:tol-pal system protein YbgF [Deltaproteobacteria bacterium]
MTTTRHPIWVVLLASVGCASPMSALRADNRRLNQEVVELRTDRRAQDRKIRDLEHELALAKEHTANDAPVPVLPVETLAPNAPQAATTTEGQRVVGVADDGGEIVYEGDAALGKAAVIDDEPRRTSLRPEAEHHAIARAPHSRPRSMDVAPAAAGDAGEDYRAAVELVKAGKSDEAITALRAFLQKYPRHDYADNAQYWLGETYYAQKDYQHALAEFRATIETYPRGNKVPDALLKVGFCYQSLGQAEKAKAVLEQVVSLYPKTEPAALAAKRLETP